MIATLATRAAADGIDVVIVTGDRDSYQLVSDPHVKVLYNRRGVSDYALYDEAGILERTKVTPAQYPEYAALRGDPSDNLPGVPGIGEKTAAKLVNTYGNLEGIYEHLDELPPKQRQNLGEARDRVFLNRQMSRLRPRRRGRRRAGRPPHGRVGPRGGARPLRPARVPHAAAAPVRGGGGAGGRHRARGARRRGRRAARRGQGRSRCSTSSSHAASPTRSKRGGRARRWPARCARSPSRATTRTPRTWTRRSCSRRR